MTGDPNQTLDLWLAALAIVALFAAMFAGFIWCAVRNRTLAADAFARGIRCGQKLRPRPVARYYVNERPTS